MIKSRIAFYISCHGLGHAMRMKVVAARILERAPSAVLFFMGSMPAWVFEEAPRVAVLHRPLQCDIGAVQRDSLHLDVAATLEKSAAFFSGLEPLVDGEVAFVRRERIDLIVGDIPPLAFLVAAEAGVPSIAVGNFSWDWIYEEYVRDHPRYGYLVDRVREAYRKADVLLRLPFHGEMNAFPNVRDIPLIARKASLPPDEVRDAMGIEKGERRKVVFVSLGGHDAVEIGEGGDADFGDYIYASYFPLSRKMKNLVLLRDRGAIPHPDIVRASDLVISKPGYCTVAECIANRTPLIYTSRDNFREFGVMEAAARRYCLSYHLPRSEFQSGAWRTHLDAFFSRDRGDFPPPIAANGADEAARIILDSTRTKNI